MIFVRLIDENGFFIVDDFVEELTEFTIETPCPSGFYHPKWDGIEWVEGGEIPVFTEEQKEQIYKDNVVALIRERYSENDEIAILRKKLANTDLGEFDTFNEYVEQCKVQAKTM